MIGKLTRTIVRTFAFALTLCATTSAWAEITKTNPVTGEEETYTYKFVGTTHIWNGTQYWQNSEGANPSAVPGVTGSNVWDPILFDASVNSINITAGLSVEGWNLRMGLYNGAKVKLNNLQKLQGNNTPMWITVDGTSQCTIGHMANAKLVNSLPLSLYSAKTGGIAWSEALSDSSNGDGSSMPFHYYLTGTGSVAFNAGISVTGNGAHVIKQADVTLTGTSQVSSKTLVSFTSSTKTFTADAAIKVYDTDGTTLATTVNLATVNTTGSTTLTTSDPVGTVELVQTSTGVVLYYVDGDPADVNVKEKTYKPSISVNFTSGTALSTAGNVGLAGYAVPGTSWNNLAVANNATLSSLNKIDSTGAATASSASVTITNTRGEWHCSSLVATSDMRAGYIDETADVTTPTVTVSGIPYDQYKVVVYTATDAANVAFGYVTINGTNYTYSDGAVAEGTTAWGASGAQDTANALAEGVNVLVSPVVSGATLTVVGHRSGNNPRGCIAAVQIVKVEQELEEGDLLIELEGDKTYSFDSAGQYSTVYVTGEGTVTFAGTASTATTLHIGPSAAVNMNGSTLTPSAVTGNGTAVYDGAQPSTTLGFDNSASWTGTVWVKNVGAYDATSKSDTNLGGATSGAASANPVNNWGNAYSFVKFTNVKGYMYAAAIPWTLILEDDGANYAWYNNNGWGSQTITIAGLKGDGTFYDEAPASGNVCNQPLNFTDGSAFLGTIYARGKRIGLGGATTAQNAANAFGQYGSICIPANGTATVSSGKTWSVYGGFIINGTLNDNGTLATLNSSAASIVSGSGTVVFTGRAPTPVDGENETKWWKNANWTGTLWIKSYAISALNSNLYGNEGSTLKFTGVTGYFAQNHVNTVPIELEDSGSTVAFNYNNGWGGELLTFSELKGTGTLQTSNAGDGGTIWVKKWAAFTGVMNLGKKQVVMGGSEPAHGNVNRGGKLVIAEGAVVTNLNATTSWTAGGGIEVNGTFAASDRTAWADGTAMTINSTGILNMYGSGINDTSKSFANVTGTGTIWYSQTTTANDKWSALPSSAANMFANTLSVSNDNVNAGVIIIMNGASDVVTTNANVSGTGWYRSDWGSGTYRGFLALQSKNTTWSGTFGSDSRLKKFIVAGVDGATDRTLTLAGTQSSTIPLTVESLGSVNITGTYLGATTVSGTFGGTGTLTGNLTFNTGSTFKAFAADDADGLVVSGTVGYPAEGKVTVDVSAIEPETDVALLKATGLDASKFALADGTTEGYSLDVVDGVLTLKLPVPAATVDITIPEVPNATVSVTADGVAVTPENGVVTVDIGAVVVVTYTADEGYQLTGDAISFTASASTTTVDVSNISVAAIVANVTSADGQTTTPYTSAASAIAAADDGETVTLLEATVTLTQVVAINKSITILSGNPSGTTITGSGLSAYPTLGAADLTLGANVTVSAQLRVLSGEATITHPTGSAPSYRPPSGYMISSMENGDDTTTITFYQQVYVIAAGTNATLADENGNQLGSMTPVASGDTFVFTVTPAAGCALVRVTADGVELTPSEGKYSISIGSSNVSIYAVAGAAVVTGGDSDVYCSSLQAAIDAATSGDTVTLLADVTLDATIAIDKTLSLDLNGYTITASGINAITTSGALTVEGSSGSVSVTSGNSVVLTSSAATLTVSSGATLSPTPTTNVSRSRVKAVTEDGTTTYSVEVIPGTIFSVW